MALFGFCGVCNDEWRGEEAVVGGVVEDLERRPDAFWAFKFREFGLKVLRLERVNIRLQIQSAIGFMLTTPDTATKSFLCTYCVRTHLEVECGYET